MQKPVLHEKGFLSSSSSVWRSKKLLLPKRTWALWTSQVGPVLGEFGRRVIHREIATSQKSQKPVPGRIGGGLLRDLMLGCQLVMDGIEDFRKLEGYLQIFTGVDQKFWGGRQPSWSMSWQQKGRVLRAIHGYPKNCLDYYENHQKSLGAGVLRNVTDNMSAMTLKFFLVRSQCKKIWRQSTPCFPPWESLASHMTHALGTLGVTEDSQVGQ